MSQLYEVENLMTDMMERDHSLCSLDDMSLYAEVVGVYRPAIKNYDFITVMSNRAELGIPSMSTVSRVKRKIYEKRPDLRPSEPARKYRHKVEEEMRAYAKA